MRLRAVSGLQASDATHDAEQAVARTPGKSPIRVSSAPGFVAKCILMAMINKALIMLDEGLATAEDSRFVD